MTVAVAHSESPRGQAALMIAAEEAVRRGEPLAVLRILPGVDMPDAADAALGPEVARKLAGFPNLTWKVHTAPEGTDTAAALLGLADDVDASVLVIGSKRRSPVGKLLLGSTVQRVLLEADMPVLLVKAS
jgi:nucleotide-binding universal stress UspA family protein